MNILHLTNGIFAPSGPLPGYYSSEVTLLQTWACQTAIAAANMPLYEPRQQFGQSRQRTNVFLRDKRTHYLVLQYPHRSFSLLLIHGRSAFPDFCMGDLHASEGPSVPSPPRCARGIHLLMRGHTSASSSLLYALHAKTIPSLFSPPSVVTAPSQIGSARIIQHASLNC